MSPEERFDELVAAFALVPRSPPGQGRGFGSNCPARPRQGIFDVGSGAARGEAAQGEGRFARHPGGWGPIDTNKGTPMKEWFSLDPTSDLEWPSIAYEAMAFVSGRTLKKVPDRSLAARSGQDGLDQGRSLLAECLFQLVGEFLGCFGPGGGNTHPPGPGRRSRDQVGRYRAWRGPGGPLRPPPPGSTPSPKWHRSHC